MKQFGYDPAPPGEYKITKALVDSDLDGVTSGAILKKVYPDIQILQGEATGMAEGKYDHLIDEQTAIVDLKYKEGAGLYFDHHESNRPSHNEFPGRWQDVGSAARVVYEYFKDVADLQKFTEIVPIVDKFDSGNITLDEFVSPDFIMQLGMAIDRNDTEYNIYVAEKMATLSLQELKDDPRVKQKVAKVNDKRKEIFEYINEHSETKSGLGFVDVTDYPGDEKIHSYLLVSQFPDIDAVVVYKRDNEKRGTKVRFYRNNFNKDARDLNLLKLARKIEPSAGGHTVACGFILPYKKSKQEFEKQVMKYLSPGNINEFLLDS